MRRLFKAPPPGMLMALVMLSALGGCALPVPAETENQAMPAIDDTERKDIPESRDGAPETAAPLNDLQYSDNDSESASVISFDGASVVARVISNGCTSSDDFSIQHTLQDDGICIARVVRNRPDYCRKVPEAIQVGIAWPLPADCIDPTLVRFANPLLAEPVRKLKRTLSND